MINIGDLQSNQQNSASEETIKTKFKIKSNKTRLAIPVTNAIIATDDLTRRFPQAIAELFEKISTDFGLKKAGGAS
ncbi:MAG: hypothetical protein HQL94_01310 [Magnetococcales bacterium]|nr:hypothetical protein [Magnetococcales bacterium]